MNIPKSVFNIVIIISCFLIFVDFRLLIIPVFLSYIEGFLLDGKPFLCKDKNELIKNVFVLIAFVAIGYYFYIK